MRTTLTIDDDLFMQLHREAEETRKPLRQVVNEALRRGLLARPVTPPVQVPRPHSLGRPVVDLTRALALANALDDERRLIPPAGADDRA